MVADMNLQAAEVTVQSLPGSSRHYAIKADVSSAESVNSLFRAVFDICSGFPTIVVNCAGIARHATSIVDTEEQSLEEIFCTNLKGTFLVTQAAAKCMIANRVCDGSIVNIASLLAKNIKPGWASYSASKAGVVALSQVAAKELASHRIRVNAVLPSLVITSMALQATSAEDRAEIAANIPLGRCCLPEELAEVVKFLCDSRSCSVTGAAVDVAGGIS